ncbi:MAG: bifunctional UDP-sugar hydrolase/5'-nucleotidase [Tumebacillaceae bacterium]
MGRVKIHFFHTNDVHSHFEEYLQAATQLRRHRERMLAQGDPVYTFEIGDHGDRKRMETEGTLGRTNAALIRAVGYDAWVFGNNEGLTLPKNAWPELVNESGVPVLIANLFEGEQREKYPFFEPYLILERGGVRVGVLGMTVAFSDFYKMFGVHAEHPRDSFARVLPELRAQGVDLVVLLSHLGLNSDRQIAEEIEGIDIIFGGHSHHVLKEPERIGDTWICQAGCFGAYYGYLAVEWDEQRRAITSVHGGAIERDPGVEPDADLSDLLAHWQEAAQERLSETIASLPVALGHDLAGNSPLAHLLTDGMRRLTGAPIGMINGGMFNHGLLAGPVSKADLLTCFPGPILTCVIELSGEQILSLLRKSLDPAYLYKVGKGYGFRGHFIGGLQVSGLRVFVDEQGEVRAEQNGWPLDPQQGYDVAASDHLYFSEVYEEFKQGRNIRFHLPFLRELLADELAGGDLQAAQEQRWVWQTGEHA